MKYLYTAKIKGTDYEFQEVKDLAEKMNDIYEYPIVTKHMLYNYFTRPKKMQSRLPILDTMAIKRVRTSRLAVSMKSSATTGPPGPGDDLVIGSLPEVAI